MQKDETCKNSLITRGPSHSNYEFVINAGLCARLCEEQRKHCAYGIYPAYHDADPGPLLYIVSENPREMWLILDGNKRVVYLPDKLDPDRHLQHRFRKERGSCSLIIDGQKVITFDCPLNASIIGLTSIGSASFEMARVTSIGDG